MYVKKNGEYEVREGGGMNTLKNRKPVVKEDPTRRTCQSNPRGAVPETRGTRIDTVTAVVTHSINGELSR